MTGLVLGSYAEPQGYFRLAPPVAGGATSSNDHASGVGQLHVQAEARLVG